MRAVGLTRQISFLPLGHNSGLSRRRTRSLAAAVTVSIAMLTSAASAFAAAPTLTNPDDLWTSAKAGQYTSAESIAESFVDNASEPLVLFRNTLTQREQSRATRLVEVRTELTEALATEPLTGVVLSEALRAATELQMLGNEPQAVLEDAQVAKALQLALAEARAAEARGDVVIASELFYRLNALHEETNRYSEDLKRLGSRLTMLRLYAPDRYWVLRNDRRLAEELEPLPPYNPTGDDFKEKLSGIDRYVVARSIVRAVQQHVDSPRPSALLAAGMRQVGVLLESDQILESILGGNIDARARDTLKQYVSQIADQYEKGTRTAGLQDITATLRDLADQNTRTLKLPEEVLLHEFGDGAMSSLDDYSQVIWPHDVDRFRRTTSGSFVGIGVQISLDALNQLAIVTPLAGTPAQRAGLRSDDVIAKVDGKPTMGFTLDQAVDVITGPRGSDVRLTIERPIKTEGEAERKVETFDVVLQRDVIDLRSVRGWKRSGPTDADWDWFLDRENGIGYVKIGQFQQGTTRDLRKAVLEMQQIGLNGLVLDLRFNPGGLLDEAVGVVGQFVASQRVVSIEGSDGRILGVENTNAGLTPLALTPTVVLINEGSASASEIVAGALQDYADKGMADVVVVGQRSFGKGSVQNVWELPAPAPTLIKLTTQYYRLPGGRLIHRDRHPDQPLKGVGPDLSVSMLPEQITESARIRRDADVVQLNDLGQPVDPENAVDPNSLIADGIDVQLHTALLLLQSRSGGMGAVASTPTAGQMQPVR
jgi:carboxyl-terminal processing protease